MRTRSYLSLILVLWFAGVAIGTPQIPDILVYEGVKYPILDEPLADYFKRYPERDPKTDDWCSANWRGYVAIFEVVDGLLVLKDITSDNCVGPVPKPEMKRVVPTGKPLVIDWFTGIVVSRHGSNEADPYSMAWLDAAEKYSLFEIESGKLGRVKHFNNANFKKFRQRQFDAYKKTPGYKDEVTKLLADGRLKQSDADFNILTWVFYSTKKFLVD